MKAGVLCSGCGKLVNPRLFDERDMPKQSRTCPDCGKPFKPMTERQWTINKYMHRRRSVRHGLLNPDLEYLERIRAEYVRERLAQGLSF